MAGCAGFQRAATPLPPAALLFQIQRRYRAEWSGLSLSVQMDSNQWTLCVRDEVRNQALYTAYRGSEKAAHFAAAEFAIVQKLGFESRMNPHHLASNLKWQESW